MLKRLFCISILIVNVFALDATMEIIKDTTKLPYITIENIGDNYSSEIGNKVYKMLIADLKVSGHFNVIEGKSQNKEIDYKEYISNNVNLVAKIHSSYDQNNLITTLMLYDVNIKQSVLSKKYNVSEDSMYPLLAHKIAVDINNYIDAPSIDWMNRFVVLSKYVKPESSDILIADYTLTFQRVIIKDGLNIFPKWANSKQDAIYFTKYYDKPTLMRYNIYTGEMNKVISSDGILIASDVSDDGNKVLLTMAPNNQPDIYLLDIKTLSTKKLTNYGGIDVGANFIDNEKRIMFISDRLGYPNIFSLDLSNQIVNQLVYHGRNNSSANAYNEYIVYSSRESENEFGSNTFNLYLVSTKSNYIRRLTSNGTNQMPRFSLDGGSIMFIKNNRNESSLGIIRLDYNKSYLFPLAKDKIQSIDW